MSHPLIDKFYELHPEKKEEPKVERKTEPLVNEIKEGTKIDTSAWDELTMAASADVSIGATQWQDWMTAYQSVGSSHPITKSPFASTASQYKNDLHPEWMRITKMLDAGSATILDLTYNTERFSSFKTITITVRCM